LASLVSLYSRRSHPSLHSFPTRRSSDLRIRVALEVQGLKPAVAALHRLARRSGRGRPTWQREADRLAKFVEYRFHVDRSQGLDVDRKSTRLNSSHQIISYAVFCLKKKIK